MSVADDISFNNFCQLCAKISQVARDKKAEVLQNYIECWKKKSVELNKNGSFYPVLRFLLPQLDRERGAYGVKEHTLAKIYIRILSLPKEGREAMKLREYRAPKISGPSAGDFAEVAYWVLKKRCAEGRRLSIEEVSNHLDAIAEKHASNEPRGVDAELISLLKATSAEEQKWLIRILLKEMKLGLGQNGILATYHPDARDLYDASNNLRKVSDLLKDSEVRLHEIEIELFSPVKPMLSEECDFQKLDAVLKRAQYFFVEKKLDGERFQLHKNGGNYKYFSRNGYDYTSNFEENLTRRISERFSPNVRSCILDGEMLSWDSESGEFVSKGKNVDVKNLRVSGAYQPCFCIFDVLFYNGRVLTNQPLISRQEILNEIINPLEGTVCCVSSKRISTKNDVLEALNEAIDNREEGIVLKVFLSVYKPNVRKNGGWYKIKPEYIDGLSDTLDLLILGGYFGSGRHKGNISHFLLGVAACIEDDAKLFYSVARVGSGYSADELAELQAKLQPFWHKTKIGDMPPEIEWTKEKPDVWIEPEKSFILEIKAAEITGSNCFRTGYSLRFPRVQKVRYDKSWKDCLSLDDFEEKRQMASGKLAFNHLTSTGGGNTEKKKAKFRSKVSIGSQYKGVDVSNIECLSNVLSGKEICVFTGFGEVTKNEVERKIVEFGGSSVQNPGQNTFCVLAESDSTVKIKNIIKCGSQDVIKTSCFFSCLNEGMTSLPQFKPHDFLFMSPRTSEMFADAYDEFGDHYTELSTRHSIVQCMTNANEKFENFIPSIDEKFSMDVELFSGPSPYSLFRFCCAYFDRFPIIEDPVSGLLPHLELDIVDFKFYGGNILEHISSDTTHVVVSTRDLSRLEEFNNRNRAREKKFHIVTEKWIESSLKNKRLSEDCGF